MGSADISFDSAMAILSKRGWFAERSESFRAAMTGIARLRAYAPGEPLYLFGDEPNGIFGLVDGGLDVSIPRDDGLDFTIHRADPGFWLGDLALFIGRSRLVSLVAASKSQVVQLPHHALRQIVEASPHFYPDFYALSYENTRLSLRLLANLATSPSEVRVAKRLLMYEGSEEELGIVVSQSKLAELVGMSPPTLHRVLHRLQGEELIEVGYGRIRILDRKRLLSFCNPT